VAQAAIFVAFGILIYHVHVAGPYWLLAVCVILGALMFLGLGFTISGFAKSIETVPVLANIIVFPMLFLGNVFFPISGMPAWLQATAAYLPLTYFASAMRGVMADGAGPLAIRHELLGMIAWAALLITLATLTFRFQEKEGA
jgi:ABC-2 type transport system permease protein